MNLYTFHICYSKAYALSSISAGECRQYEEELCPKKVAHFHILISMVKLVKPELLDILRNIKKYTILYIYNFMYKFTTY